LGPAAGEDRRVVVVTTEAALPDRTVACKRHSRRTGRVLRRAAVAADDLMADLVPVVDRLGIRRRRLGCRGSVTVELEAAGVVDGLRAGDVEERERSGQEDRQDEEAVPLSASRLAEQTCRHYEVSFGWERMTL